MPRRPRALFLASLLAACAVLAPSTAHAGERERIFLIFGGSEASVLEAEAAKFRSPVLTLAPFEFAGSQEMEAIYSECSEAIGTDADTRRECQLRAANRVMVTQILEISGRKLDKKQFELVLEVWSPETNGLLWSAVLEVEGDSLARTARSAYPELAERYLCWRGIQEACPEDQRTSEPAPQPEPVVTPVATPEPARPTLPAPIPDAPIEVRPEPPPARNPAPRASSGADRDGDTVADNLDYCPEEPEDVDGFQDQDGCPDPDNDGDGSIDAMDQCPSDPEDKDDFQDEDGCPDFDDDGDGIADANDHCYREAETFNGVDDADGCPD